MATNYFRVTVYHEAEDFSIIMDSFGMYEKLWQFSSFFIQKGFQVLEVSSDEKFLDVNIKRANPCPDNMILRETGTGRPEKITYTLDGVTYHAVKLKEKIYIPDRSITVTGGAV